MCEWWRKRRCYDDDSSDINIYERGDETEESDKNDESSINVSSDDTDNDNEVMESVLSVIYEAYFWKSFKESMNKENEIPIQTIVNMTSSWKGNQYINHANNIKTKPWSYLKINFYNSVNGKTTQ